MYRCTECKALYEELPEFCDCGNDQFVEIKEQPQPKYAPPVDEDYDEDYEEQGYDEYEEYEVERPKKKKKLSKEELREIAEEKLDKKKALITISIAAFISLMILVLPPYPQKKADKVAASQEKESYSKLPAVGTYWDDTLPSYARYKDKYYNLPILNKHFAAISPVLREYLVGVGNEFNRKWDATGISGNGEARITFVIDPDGKLEYKQLSTKSNNESLDDSVLLVLSKMSEFDVPPDDYKGEKIILSFKVKDGGSKVSYPDKF